MTATHDEGTAGKRSPSSTRTLNGSYRNRGELQEHVVAHPIFMTSRTGNTRLLLLYRCTSCTGIHTCVAPVPAPTIVRRAACGVGLVVLHTSFPSEYA